MKVELTARIIIDTVKQVDAEQKLKLFRKLFGTDLVSKAVEEEIKPNELTDVVNTTVTEQNKEETRKLHELLNFSVHELDNNCTEDDYGKVFGRFRNRCYDVKVYYLGELVQYKIYKSFGEKRTEFFLGDGIGYKTRRFVIAELEKLGLSFGMDVKGWVPPTKSESPYALVAEEEKSSIPKAKSIVRVTQVR